MSATIFEVLKEARRNLREGQLDLPQRTGREQLNNVIKLIDKGRDVWDIYNLDDLKKKDVK